MMNVRDFQLAKAELLRALREFRGGKNVTVGIHEDAGKVVDGSITQAQNGALQNFGDPHNTLNGRRAPIPARPWLIPGVESATQDISDSIQESIMNGATLDQTLDAVGAFAAGATQQYITDLKNPPNAAYTIAQKGSSNPLIDTGSMRASVTWKVTSEEHDEGLS